MANDEHLHKAFSYFDKNSNGYIEPDELRDALMEDGADDCTDVANDIFHEVDTDKVRVQEVAYDPTMVWRMTNLCDFFLVGCRTGLSVMMNLLL